MKFPIALVAAALLTRAIVPGSGAAQENFYQGKTIRMIVGTSAGGGFDTYTRTIARHFGKHVPGQPSIVVDNMAGAGHLIAANHMYRVAKPDGLTLGHFHGGWFLYQLFKRPGIEFDATKFEFLGSPIKESRACAFTKASGITSVERWLASKTPVKVGGIGGGAPDDMARMLAATTALPIQLVSGYKGTAEIRLAAESGELAGACFAWESFKTTWRKGLESGDFGVIVQAMPKKHPELPNVPLANDYVKTEEERRLLKHGVYDTAIITRPYFLSPGTPKPRVQLLRRAFANTLKDPDFLAEAKKASLDIQYVSGEETEAVVQGLFKIEPAFNARMKQVLVP